MKTKLYKQCLGHLGREKDSFRVVVTEICELLELTDDYKEIKMEIYTFINSKVEDLEVIKKGEIEKLPHFSDLPCCLETVLTYDLAIHGAFRYYVWTLIQSGEIDVEDWNSFDEIVSSEIGYLTAEE